MTVSVGLVGAGGIGRRHASNLSEAGRASLEAVCDPDAERAASVASTVDAAHYADHRDLLAAADLDAVYVATPPQARTEIVRDLAERGIAIFCEKPLAADLGDGRAIADVVKSHGTPFMMGFCLRFCEPCLRLKELVASGAVGEPVTLVSARAGWGVPEAGNWRVDPEQACGVTVESASHNVDLLRWLGGEIASASGATANVTHPDLERFDDNVVATAAFESGAIGSLQNSWTSRVEYLRHGVVGTEGAAVVEGDEWWRLDRLTHAQDGERPRAVEFDAETATDMGYRGETRAFLDAVAAGEDPPVGVRDGLRALEVSHEILGSSA
jgi:predicted dehydrogenase